MRHLTWRTFGIMVPAVALMLAVAHAAATLEDPGMARALADQRAVVEERGSDPVAFNDLGNLLALSGQTAEAETAYRRALELDSSYVLSRFNLALLLIQTGQPRAARTELEAVIQHQPEHAWAHYQLGVLAETRRDRSAAIDHYAHAFALDHRLSFPVENPHVIDNRVVTESLLRAQKYVRIRSTRQVPRQFGETNRIRDVMLRPEPSADDEPEMSVDGDESERMGNEGDQPSARFDAPVLLPDDDDPRSAERGEGRVLSSDDLDASSRSGEVVGGAPPPTTRGAGSVFNRYRPPTTTRTRTGTTGRSGTGRSGTVAPQSRTVTPRTRGGAVQPQSGGAADRQDDTERTRSERFRPSTRSSAQLDTVLEPVSPAGAG